MRDLIKKLHGCLHKNESKKSNADKIYKIHKYWARKPWYVVDEYIEKYCDKNDLILDPFCGSGVIGGEALCLGRNFHGVDLNPMSIRIADATMDNDSSIEEIENDFAKLKEKCENRILELYATNEKCPKCGELYYVKHLVCAGANAGKASVYCKCGSKTSKQINLDLDGQNRELKEKYWVPEDLMPEKFFKDRFSYKGVNKVTDFYSKRALSSLSFILDSIKKLNTKNEKFFLIAFTNTLLHCSKLKGENVRPMSVNNYWIPNDYIDENVWFRFEDRCRNMIGSKIEFKKRCSSNNSYTLTLGSALDIKNFPRADYVFADPPYGETIQYSELSYIWNSWLDDKYEIEEEIIINPMQNKGTKEFNSLLNISLDNIYKSLKDEKYFTLCFANKEFKIWDGIISHCKQLGFALISIESYDTYGAPFNKNWAKFSPKSDVYVTFKKTRFIDYDTLNLDVNFDMIVESIAAFYDENNYAYDLSAMFDLTVSVIIWLMFYNRNSFNVGSFNIKNFKKKISSVCSRD